MTERYDLHNPDQLATVKEMLHPEVDWEAFMQERPIGGWLTGKLKEIVNQAGRSGLALEGPTLRLIKEDTGEPAIFRVGPAVFTALLEDPEVSTPIFVPVDN